MTEEICSKCNGTRHIYTENGTFANCECLKDLVMRNELLKSGVDISFFDRELSLDIYKPNTKQEEEALKVTKKLIENIKVRKSYPDSYYCFSGEPASGKSFLTYFIIKQAIKSGYRCKSITLQDLFNSYIQCGQEIDGVKEAGLNKYMKYSVLVIDCGREVYNKLLGTVISMITADRKDRGLQTIFTSLFRSSEFLKRYSKQDELDGIFNSKGYVKFLNLGSKDSKSVDLTPEEIWENKLK